MAWGDGHAKLQKISGTTVAEAINPAIVGPSFINDYRPWTVEDA